MHLKRKAIICYLSYSGNTQEVAEIIEKNLISAKYNTKSYRIGSGVIPDLSIYDLILLGTFTYGKGKTPEDMKDFIREVGYKPDNIAVFGTGDTQFGGKNLEYYCGANDKLVKFYNSKYSTLKVEQSPRGQQESKVNKWIKEVIEHDRKIEIS